ncbi:hypothetical protein [Flagellimonas baculiformis]|uniref:hypothetical protein n=1 Tax=Flagellimonas baculiformis TaxID=3067310 RepID=UPI00296FB736|nr:hypothetical protein [Muricauda sp. D6]
MLKKIFVIVVLFAVSCNTPKESEDVYSITSIQQEKDGKTLFLKDANGAEYTTVISIPNGNYVEVEVGDRVKLEINEVLEDMKPILIISRSVEVLD